MKFQQIRNATIVLEYAGKRILIDPLLAEKGAYPGFPGTVNSHLNNPLVDLPVSANDLLAGVDAIIVTHTHPDHWDEAAKQLIPKDLLIFVQNERDQEEIKSAGFTNLHVLTEETIFGEIKILKTLGQHGTDNAMEKAGEVLGEVCGVVLKHLEEKSIYIAGDTIWNEYVTDSLKKYLPDVIVLNSGDARVIGVDGSIIMDKEDVYKVSQEAPNAIIIASHMEAINHCLLTRKELGEFVNEKGLKERVLIPEDGESYKL